MTKEEKMNIVKELVNKFNHKFGTELKVEEFIPKFCEITGKLVTIRNFPFNSMSTSIDIDLLKKIEHNANCIIFIRVDDTKEGKNELIADMDLYDDNK